MNRQPTTQQLQVLTARGTDGTITFDGQTVTIRRRGLLARMVHGAGDVTCPSPASQPSGTSPAASHVAS